MTLINCTVIFNIYVRQNRKAGNPTLVPPFFNFVDQSKTLGTTGVDNSYATLPISPNTV